jgi:hypothetical protein
MITLTRKSFILSFLSPLFLGPKKVYAKTTLDVNDTFKIVNWKFDLPKGFKYYDCGTGQIMYQMYGASGGILYSLLVYIMKGEEPKGTLGYDMGIEGKSLVYNNVFAIQVYPNRETNGEVLNKINKAIEELSI